MSPALVVEGIEEVKLSPFNADFHIVHPLDLVFLLMENNDFNILYRF
jgi:hypothetical protein